MKYYYNLSVNLHQSYYKFYEWDKEDPIHKIKKIEIIRVPEKTMKDFMNYEIHFSSLINSINLFSSSRESIVLEIDHQGNTIRRSSLLIEDENNCNELVYDLPNTNISYQKLEGLKEKETYREEEKNVLKIKQELETILDTHNIDKCTYLYYEWFHKVGKDIKTMIQEMLESIPKNKIQEFSENL